MKALRYRAEAALVGLLFFIFGMMKPAQASAIGGWIGRSIGPRLAVSRKAMRNIERALPETNENDRKRICRGMWDNLGRVFAEYPHLETIARDFTAIEGLDSLQVDLKKNKSILYIGGHFANWELNAIAPFVQHGIRLDLTYRAPNNPWSAKLLDRIRTLGGRITAYPKSRESGRAILHSLKQGRSLGILIDQKYNEGVETLFFGKPAMTNPVFVNLCQKYQCPLIPARTIREEGCRFRLKIYPPIAVFNPDGSRRRLDDVIAETHTLLEGWIREKPEQWMWLHRRWKT